MYVLLCMINKEFNDWYNIFKVPIAKMCLKYYYQTNNRIEYRDLFQEASMTLLILYKEKKIKGFNYTIEAIKNTVVNYIAKNSLVGTTNILGELQDD